MSSHPLNVHEPLPSFVRPLSADADFADGQQPQDLATREPRGVTGAVRRGVGHVGFWLRAIFWNDEPELPMVEMFENFRVLEAGEAAPSRTFERRLTAEVPVQPAQTPVAASVTALPAHAATVRIEDAEFEEVHASESDLDELDEWFDQLPRQRDRRASLDQPAFEQSLAQVCDAYAEAVKQVPVRQIARLQPERPR